MGSCRVGDACRFLHDDKEKGTLTIGGTPSSPAAVNLEGKRVRFVEKREVVLVEVAGRLGNFARPTDVTNELVKKCE